MAHSAALYLPAGFNRLQNAEECEALPPDVLARIVLEAIEAQIDLKVLAGVKREEVKQRKQLLAALPVEVD